MVNVWASLATIGVPVAPSGRPSVAALQLRAAGMPLMLTEMSWGTPGCSRKVLCQGTSTGLEPACSMQPEREHEVPVDVQSGSRCKLRC
jgi:hypothetical protein